MRGIREGGVLLQVTEPWAGNAERYSALGVPPLLATPASERWATAIRPAHQWSASISDGGSTGGENFLRFLCRPFASL